MPSIQEVKGENSHEVMGQAVARCLTGQDVIPLSGGVDSPAVAGLAAPLHPQSTSAGHPQRLSLDPEHPKVDERPYIESVTEYLGMRLHTWTSKATRFSTTSPSGAKIPDGPIPSITAAQMHEFYLEARRLGFRNILTGDVAECLVELQQHVAGHLLIHGRWVALARLFETQKAARRILAKNRELAEVRLAVTHPVRARPNCELVFVIEGP